MAQLDWHGEYAYTTGMQAFIYGFPTSTTLSSVMTG